MQSRARELVWRAALIGAAATAAAVLAGCAETRASAFRSSPAAGPSAAALVMQGEAITAYERSADGSLAFERWEYSRGDADVGVIRNVALSATRQWPEPPKPFERRIHFSDWTQR